MLSNRMHQKTMTSTKYNKLIIQVSLQDFTFCVKNQLSNVISHFKTLPINSLASIENQLEIIFSQHELLQVNYDDVLILHDNNMNTFIPDEYFDERTLGSYLQYNTKVFATDFFTYDELEIQKMKNVYVPNVAFNNFFIDQFGEFVYKHVNTNLVEFVLEETKSIEDFTVHIHVGNNHFELIVSQKGKLHFFNSFEFQTPEDFIYYILFVFEQLKLNTEKTPIHLFGNIIINDANYQIIYNYIRNVHVIDLETKATAMQTEASHLQKNFILLHS